MYYPVLRGKLNELLALRELALLGFKNFCPVIEPVKKDLGSLARAVRELNQSGIKPNIIMNPSVGELRNEPLYISEILNEIPELDFIPCFMVNDNLVEISKIIGDLGNFSLFITKGLNQEIIDLTKNASLVFLSHNVSPALMLRIKNIVLYGDFFKRKKRNADYESESEFSALHTYYHTYPNVVGFGDYTIVGEEFSEGGGPAYVITIHASYIDKNRFDELFIRHYLSDDDGTPTNPGNKFKQALKQLILDVDGKTISFTYTNALKELKVIYKNEHFPGLGQAKKISMKHHIETINNYLENKKT